VILAGAGLVATSPAQPAVCMTGRVRPQEAGSEQTPDLQDAHIVPFDRYSNGKPKDKAPSISAALRAFSLVFAITQRDDAD
jgi:hypothetical protein